MTHIQSSNDRLHNEVMEVRDLLTNKEKSEGQILEHMRYLENKEKDQNRTIEELQESQTIFVKNYEE